MNAGSAPPVLQTPAGYQAPQLGQELGRGAEGIVFRIPNEPGWVVFHQGGNPLAARNQLDNLARARAIRPDNVVEARPLLDPANPRSQNWLVEEEVMTAATPEDAAAKAQLLQDFLYFPDASGNLFWGTTISNGKVRWILIE